MARQTIASGGHTFHFPRAQEASKTALKALPIYEGMFCARSKRIRSENRYFASTIAPISELAK